MRKVFEFSEKCPMTDAMKNPAIVPDSAISSYPPGKNSPADSRPGKQGWRTPVPKDNDKLPTENKPFIEVNLVPNQEQEPIDVESVVVKGSVKAVTVMYTTREDFLETTPTPVSTTPSQVPGFITVISGRKVPPGGKIPFDKIVRADKVRVVFEEPQEYPNTTRPKEYKVTLGIHACVEFEGILVLWFTSCTKFKTTKIKKCLFI